LVTVLLVIGSVLAMAVSARPAAADSAAEIDRNVDATLTTLQAKVPAAHSLLKEARGVLVFPNIVKAGFLFGAQYGEGALRQGGRTVGYYNTVTASYGLQAGVQVFGYVLFLMNDSALAYLDTSGGLELGTGPSLVVLDVGAAKALTTTTLHQDIYAIVFDQRGLMAGLGLQGSKISRIER
jgi:lipid-binding SYLF domain-containing protein